MGRSVEPNEIHPLRPGPYGLLTVLSAVAVCAPGAGVVGAGILLTSAEEATARTILAALLVVLGGGVVGAAAWAMSWLVRSQYESMSLQHRLLDMLNGLDALPSPAQVVTQAAARTPPILPPPPAKPAIDPAAVTELLALIKDLNANLMFTDDERRTKRQRQLGEQAAKDGAAIQAAIDAGDFHAADEKLRRFAEDFPCDTRPDWLGQQLASARQAAQDRDVARQTGEADNLMALARFDDALKTATNLAQKHPQSQAAAELLDRVKREANAFAAEQTKRLYREVERHSEGRRWRQALEHASRLLSLYPDSTEAHEVVLILQTLQENARIEEVRQMRDTLRDMIERRRYGEALGVARQIIARFPGTTAAAELASQLPRLEELSRNGGRP